MKLRKIESAVILLLVFMLAGCSGKKQLLDEDILEGYLYKSDQFYPELELVIYDFKIIDRKTDADKKYDCAIVEVSAQNGFVDIKQQYSMLSHLYDQGWYVESINPYNVENRVITPLVGPDSYLVSENVYSDSYDMDMKFEEGLAYYTYKEGPTFYENCIETLTREVTFKYDYRDFAWEYLESNIIDVNRQWDINGTWEITENPYLCAMGGAAVRNSDYKLMADINVDNNTVARVHIYAVGDFPQYYAGVSDFDIYLDPEMDYSISEEKEFTRKNPGFYPIKYYGRMEILLDEIILSDGYTRDFIFERISTQNAAITDGTGEVAQSDDGSAAQFIDDQTWNTRGYSTDWKDHIIHDTLILPSYTIRAIEMAKQQLNADYSIGTLIVGSDYTTRVLISSNTISDCGFTYYFYDENDESRFRNVDICFYPAYLSESELETALQGNLGLINSGYKNPFWIYNDGEYNMVISYWMEDYVNTKAEEIEYYKNEGFNIIYM